MTYSPEKNHKQLEDTINSPIEVKPLSKKRLLLGGFVGILIIEYLILFFVIYLTYFD